MRIAIDARWIFPELSGIGLHTRELIKHLASLEDDSEYWLLFDNDDTRLRTLKEIDLMGHPRFTPVLLDYGVFSVRGQFRLPQWLKDSGIDVYHSTNYMIPLPGFPKNKRGKVGCVTTIHDVIPMLFRDAAPRSRKERLFPVYKRIMVEAAGRSDAIITVSETSRSDIISQLELSPAEASRIRVIQNAVSSEFTPGPGKDAPDDAGKVVLYVGRSDPYKNICGLIEAFAALLKEGIPAKLRIIGSPDSRYPEPSALANELGIAGSVEWSGHMSSEELIEAYRTADVLAHPSRYEGFGLQILEAMACGLPVVSSNAASLPEVAGEAAILVDPDDNNGFTRALNSVLTGPATAERLSRAGLEQASKFTWTKTAEQTLAVYREVVS